MWIVLIRSIVVHDQFTSVFLDYCDSLIEFLIDTSDLEFVKSLDGSLYCLEIDGKKYILVNKFRRYVYLSRLLLGVSDGDALVDFKNDDTLDLRRSNLICVTESGKQLNRRRLNSNNSSGFRGVSWDRKRGKWVASVKYRGKSIWLGYFSDKTEAARVAEEKRKELMFGEVLGSKADQV
jgi:hypothetical protein